MFFLLTLFGEGLTSDILQVLLVGGTVMVGIEGLKNIPWFDVIFQKYPKIAVLANAVGSLTLALGACLVMKETVVSVTCILTAVGTFLTAAGWHFIVKRVTTEGARLDPVK